MKIRLSPISHFRIIPQRTFIRTFRASPLAKQDAVSPKATLPKATPPSPPPPPPPSISDALAAARPEDNNLLAPVHVPEDQNAVLKSRHPSAGILTQSGLVVQRQIEMMNVFLGFEQANRYIIMDPHGNHVGYMAEYDGGIGKAVTRQWLRTHRAFTTNVFDRSGQEVLRFQRPFSWINTRIRVYDPLDVDTSHLPLSSSTDLITNPDMERRLSSVPLEAMRIIGEAHSEWAPLRRKYNLFLSHDVKSSDPSFTQFASIDEPFLSWDFSLFGEDKRLIGSVNRNFAGFAREIFTDTGVYALRMDSAGLEEEAEKRHVVSQTGRAYSGVLGGTGMTLDQRAVMLATAVTVDYDYFSRHSHGSGGMMLPFMWGGGGEAAGGAVGGAAAGEAVEGAVVGTAGRVGGVAAGEGAIAGAGTMAGYEAMQRGMSQPSAEQSPQDSGWDSGSPPADGGDAWGAGSDPWSEGASGGGSEGGGGFFSWLWDMFFGD